MEQHKCKGVLVFEQAGGTHSYSSTCYGLNTSQPEADAVDLLQHHEASRTPHMQPGSNLYMHSLTCVGMATYQHHPAAAQGEVPPPFCLGIEFMRYGKAVMKLRQPAGTVEAHTTSLASTVSAAPDASDGPSIPVPGYQYTTHEHHHQLSHAHKSTSQDTDASDGGSSQQPAHALQAEAAGAQQQRLNLMERLEQTREQFQERLEGKDPLWFAKAFANRAELNLQSMRRMAGQLAAAARADLGLGPEPSDDDN